MMHAYNNSNQPNLTSEDITTVNRGKILFVGSLAQEISDEFLGFSYSKYTINSYSKAFYWLENQILAGKELPVAIISDFALWESDVYSFYFKLSSHKSFKQIPFIVLAKNTSREEKIKSLKVGIDDFYIDQYNPADIHDRIQFLIEFKKLTVSLEPEPQISLNLFLPLFRMPMLKRLTDILFALTSLLILSPLMLIIALLIKLESKGPVFYVSKRAGTGYRIFNFYKYRSMRVGADQEIANYMHLNQYANDGNSSFVKIENDPRSTKIGKFLRNSSLDELPQLINVLKGDMSLVGNRPLPLYEAEKLTKDQWAKRFLAPAGITGLWQITKRGRHGSLSEEERMDLDIAYAEKSSFIFDLGIILRTVPAVFQGKNA
jgi:lipopolysaccharide/colanic/teichoic acid biosynthesis glycosyltransferase